MVCVFNRAGMEALRGILYIYIHHMVFLEGTQHDALQVVFCYFQSCVILICIMKVW